ncbi:hypothetical protein LZT28_00430 [Aeromonas media]|uniref:Uncharacterized protein n=1 Tax=Aeromonas media TaxID=651 RepID=A0AAW5RDE4_AERME|nr:hypothetical protein [Aeromonas media]MCV3286725.1 hypothetical protein [Aeromonas media]
MKDEKPFWGKRQAAHSGLKVDDLDAQAERALKQACGFADTVRRDRRPLPRRHVRGCGLSGPPRSPFYWQEDQWLFTSARGVGMICRAKKDCMDDLNPICG